MRMQRSAEPQRRPHCAFPHLRPELVIRVHEPSGHERGRLDVGVHERVDIRMWRVHDSGTSLTKGSGDPAAERLVHAGDQHHPPIEHGGET